MRDTLPAVGVDLDGVLANQIEGVLPRIKERYGLDLTYADITDWRLPVGPTDIAKEIVESQTERQYVLAMPMHHGAPEMLRALANEYRIVVLTARAGDALAWSREWLDEHGLMYDELVGSAEAKKSLHGVDALVDDYLGNVLEFLRNTGGPAVLVDQPWNQIRADLREFEQARRVATVNWLCEVPRALSSLSRIV